MPSSPAVRMTTRADSAPARWPSMRGKWRCRAQRPCPSMIIATWRGREALASELRWAAWVLTNLSFHALERVENSLQGVERRFFLRVERLPQITHGVRNRAHRPRQRRPAGVGMAAALEFLGNLERLPVTAAQAGDDDAIRPPEERQQHGVTRRLLLQQLMHDQIIIAHDRIHKADRGADFRD